MAERSMLDPFGLWAGLASQVEKLGNQVGQDGMKSAEFSALMNKALAGSMTARKAVRELMRRYLEVMNLPSRDDVTALAEQLRALEDRLVDVAAALERLAPDGGTGGRASVPIPPRTRKPPDVPAAGPAASAAPATPPAAAGASAAPLRAKPRKAAAAKRSSGSAQRKR